MDDFAFPDEENLLKMQKEYEKVLGGKTVVSSLSLSKNGGKDESPRGDYLNRIRLIVNAKISVVKK